MKLLLGVVVVLAVIFYAESKTVKAKQATGQEQSLASAISEGEAGAAKAAVKTKKAGKVTTTTTTTTVAAPVAAEEGGAEPASGGDEVAVTAATTAAPKSAARKAGQAQSQANAQKVGVIGKAGAVSIQQSEKNKQSISGSVTGPSGALKRAIASKQKQKSAQSAVVEE